MLTLIEWDVDHYIAWDTNGKMAAIYEEEIDQGILYQNGTMLMPHNEHHAFVYWKIRNNAQKENTNSSEFEPAYDFFSVLNLRILRGVQNTKG